jgi:hypothetical protein
MLSTWQWPMLGHTLGPMFGPMFVYLMLARPHVGPSVILARARRCAYQEMRGPLDSGEVREALLSITFQSCLVHV